MASPTRNPLNKPMDFFHSGDLGDVLYALPALRGMGGGNLYLNSRPWTAEMSPARVNVLKPLLEIQEYIGHVNHGNASSSAVDFSTFRNGGLPFGSSLVELQADWIGVEPVYKPWLVTDKADPRGNGRVICHRSPRYHNDYFRWDLIGEKLGDRILIVGLPEEADNLRQKLGFDAEYLPTKDYLELSRLITSCDFVVGNQSSPMALALGLGVPVIQETCLWVCDCMIPRENAEYCYAGEVKSLGIPQVDLPPDIDRSAMPPQGWIVSSSNGESMTARSHKSASNFLISSGDFENTALGIELASQEVDRQQVKRLPELQRRNSHKEVFFQLESKLPKHGICN